MLTIRLSRIGKRKQPFYRLIISEKARDPQARVLEILGSYNPFTKEFKTKADRISYWLGQGAKTSVTVNNLLVDKGVIKGEKIRAVRVSRKRQEAQKTAAVKKDTPAPALAVKKEEAKTE
jgi:small subunit ribosomal protein S16